MLWMEPSAACNLDCPGCPTASGRFGGVMRHEDFLHVINQSPWLRILNLWHRGEPLVATDFPAMAAEASRRGIWTQTHTNGLLLSKGNCAEKIVRSGLNRITIGVDGADEETYNRIRRGGSLAEVEAGVRALVEARRKRRSRKPQIVAECLVSSQSPDQFRAVRAMALAWGSDRVLFKTYKVPSLDDMDDALSLLPDNPKLWRYAGHNGKLSMKRRRDSCRRLNYSTVIAWNGEVLPCCFSTNDFHSQGNAFEQPLKDIWRSEKYVQFRHVVNNGGRELIPMCRNCTEGLRRIYIPENIICR